MMQQNKPVVLFDIDYTLFNRDIFLESLFDSIGSLFKIDKKAMAQIGQTAYKETVNEFNRFKPKEFSLKVAKALGRIRGLRKIEDIAMAKYNRPESLYEETLETISEVSRIAVIGIFSKGHKQFQVNKVRKFKHLLHVDHVYMGVDKYKTLPKIIDKYKQTKLYLIDDLLDILYLAKKLKNDIVTIWVKRGIYAASQELIPGFKPDAIITNISDIVSIIKNN
ncbi:MAG: hypothetical protein A3B47_00105 [Candidatus Levybacteria bacterium RIFCSPLOWO2_01_FULL_39_24]|nr:MAG: hypothetical protein A2800_01085 [Candidatus Levybacteria bacterium RIFCSPHIGHO2_01_FULL_40_16]OGH28335.1 MAG: hypothetical protein A3E12_01380 [Candidatus Levybacteria bacterium RIFCSPHIGHO2_12_FULL_39_9]OGH46179.1 MAG: hypothetical protein A3B47_00105 [Candidatus Levybacteria bacterium RIFCSPLOWO2_01_FULL_39_24]